MEQLTTLQILAAQDFTILLKVVHYLTHNLPTTYSSMYTHSEEQAKKELCRSTSVVVRPVQPIEGCERRFWIKIMYHTELTYQLQK